MPGSLPRTMFDTPLVFPLLRGVSVLYLRLTGWRVEGVLPVEAARSVLVGAPHTSNWDLPYALMIACVLRLHLQWMGKHTILRPPFGALMRWLGAIPVHRGHANSLVASSVDALSRASGPLQLAIAPEGTRKGTGEWKTGFYHIARGAQVPIVLAYIDFERKIGGLGPMLHATGDIDADMQAIKRFYLQFNRRTADRVEA